MFPNIWIIAVAFMSIDEVEGVAVRIVIRPTDSGRVGRDFARSQIVGRHDVGGLAHHDVVEGESRPPRVIETELIDMIVG